MSTPDNCPTLNTSLTPVCDLSFRLSTQYTNTSSSPSTPNPTVTPADVDFKLELCKDTVVFNNIECAKNLTQVVLGIPLRFVKDCFSYTVDLPAIPDMYDSLIQVKELNTQEVLPIDLQVANGYLYVLIDVTDQINTEGDDAPSLELCFDVFCFPMSRKMIPCNCSLKCRPVTWTYGYGQQA